MRLPLGRFRRRRTAALAVGGLVIAAVAVIPALPAAAATGCNVTYAANPWTESPTSGGFTANITIKNTGDALSSWTLKFTLPTGQSLQQGWSANWTTSGSAVTGTSLSYNGSLATGASTSLGFNGRWSGSYSSPTAFTINGVACNGGTTPTTAGPTTAGPTSARPTTAGPTTAGPTTAGPTSARPTTAGPTTAGPTTGGPTSITPCTSNCPAHVDNPYSGAVGYVNPEWKAHATAEPGGSKVANTSTAVWLDRVATIEGTSTSMGLRAHLDAALAQVSGGVPVVAQFVIYDLPNRDCAALASNGEFKVSEDGLNKYKTLYIDPIAAILADPKYKSLRISLVVEDDSLPNLVTNLGIAACAEANSSGAYVQGIQYALNKFHAISNVYNYLDIGHHAWLGWDSNFGPAVTLLANTVKGTTAGFASVDGFISNTANYSSLTEPYFNINTSVNGTSVRQSTWVGWNQYVDELSFTQAFRTALVGAGFPSSLGMLIDTSRNGWGGSARPTGPSTSTNVDTFVNASKIDRRIHAGNWCNQSGAGLGERPKTAPAAGIDAYVWIKPPGESDGASQAVANDQGKGFDRMCDPTYTGNSLNGNSMTGALPNSPLAGAWFSAQFQQLVANAYPPLP
jgi:cellulose 1,4-beta-cellobiosidase